MRPNSFVAVINAVKNWKYLLALTGLVLFLIGNGLLLARQFYVQTTHQFWVSHTLAVLSEIDQVRNAIVDAETGQRGYLLTHDLAFLRPYEDGLKAIADHTRRMDTLVADNAEQTAAIRELKTLLDERAEHLAMVLTKYKTELGRDGELRGHLIRGAELMRQLRSHLSEMRRVEENLLTMRTQALQERRAFFFLVLGLSTFFSVAAVMLAGVLVRKNQLRLELDRQRTEKEGQIREALATVARSLVGRSSVKDLAVSVQSFLVERLNILASKFFIEQHGSLHLVAVHGTKFSTESDLRPTGLVEQALAKTGPWKVDVPDQYWTITSALGAAKPATLVFLPLRFQDRILGLIEMGSFGRIDDVTFEILTKLCDIVAAHLNAALASEELQHLLEKTQQQAEELEGQQEELRTNNEELEQQARVLEGQQQALNIKNRELEDARGDLERKAVDLQRSSQYKSDFLAKMSHELRTPLNGLLILSTLLAENKDKNLTDQQRQFAQSINSAGNDLLLLINDILDLSKIEARKLAIRTEDFLVSDVITSLTQSFEPQADSKKISFNLRAAEDALATKMHTDRQRLEQILRNFLSNALKFTAQGSVTLEVQTDSAKRILFKVRDTGIGIAPNKQALIFEAFEQADGSVSRRFGGTGLGLTISRELAHLLNGSIEVESRESEGSCFTLKLPVNLEESRDEDLTLIEKAHLTSPPKGPEHLSEELRRLDREAADALKHLPTNGGRTLLVVEDDPAFLKSIVTAVESQGFNCVSTRDGEVALAILDRLTPDGILLDIKLPGISGLGVLEMIKRAPHLRHIPVHMISGLEYQHSALRLGALGYLTKPVTLEKIRSAMDRVRAIMENKIRRVLLIEDDPRQSEGIAHLIAGQDVEIQEARTGNEALAKLRQGSYDCVILDLSLPDMNGLELLKELNGLEISLPPVVIYTAKDLSPDEEEQLRRYSESIIIKGARSPERLLDEVNLFLHRVESLLPEEKREMLNHFRTQKDRFENETVLLVDDDMRNLFALTSVLEGKNLNVLVAKDGVEALEKIGLYPEIRLVLMDIMMPRMSGFEAMRAIRNHADERIRTLPVVALTAKAMREDHEKCIAEGANDYISKPVDLNQLNTVLKVWLTPKGIFA